MICSECMYCLRIATRVSFRYQEHDRFAAIQSAASWLLPHDRLPRLLGQISRLPAELAQYLVLEVLQEAVARVRIGRGLALVQRLVWVAAVAGLVDGLVDAADGAVEAGTAQDELDDAVLKGGDGAEGPPVPGHGLRVVVMDGREEKEVVEEEVVVVRWQRGNDKVDDGLIKPDATGCTNNLQQWRAIAHLKSNSCHLLRSMRYLI